MSQTPAMKQHTFAGGEISQELTGRTDLERYAQSVGTCKNWLITPTGVAKNRPGTKFVAEVADSSKRTRLIPFIFSQNQQYVLEVGEGYMRFHQDGGVLLYKDVQSGECDNTDATGQVMDDLSGHDAWATDFYEGAVIRNLTTDEEDVVVSNNATRMVMDGTSLPAGWTTNDEYEVTQHEGTHTGTTSATLTDSAKDWDADTLVGGWVYNTTDGSSGRITAHTDTTITAILGGGVENAWTNGDEYYIEIQVQVATPWQEEDIPYLRYAQQNDLMILVCPGYTPYELRRYADDDWRLSVYDITRPTNPPTGVGLKSTYTAKEPDDTVSRLAEEWDWVVTSVDSREVESLPSVAFEDDAVTWEGDDTSIGLADNSCKGVYLEWTAPLAGNTVARYNIYRGLNGIYGYIGSTEEPDFRDEGNVPDYSDGPPTEINPFIDPVTANRSGEERLAADDSTGAGPWSAEKLYTPESYNGKYTYTQTVYTWPGQTIDLTFTYNTGAADVDLETIQVSYDVGVGGAYQVHDVSRTYDVPTMDLGDDFKSSISGSGGGPYISEGLFVRWNEDSGLPEEVDTFPNSVCFFEQRLAFGGFSNNPGQIKLSRTGDYYNFDKSEPLKEDDQIDLTLSSLRNDAIIDLAPLEKLFIFTAGSEWVVQGADGGPLTPTSFDAKARTMFGAANVHALPVGNSVLFVGERSRQVREFSYDGLAQSGNVRNLTVMVEHLFRQHTVEEWAYADVPYQIVYAVRSDGALLGMTYVKEHNMWAWHRHMTGTLDGDGAPDTGKFESVCTINEGSESKIYTVVNRTIDGNTVRYIEVFAERQFVDAEDYIFLDSALTYDGRNTGATQLKLEPVTGTHTAANDGFILTDSTKTWVPSEWSSGARIIKNTTDASQGAATANTSDTITVTTGTLWNTGDAYEITTTWAASEKLSLFSDTAGTFHADMVGEEFELTVGNDTVRVRVSDYFDDQHMECWAVTVVVSGLQRTYTTTWARCPNTFVGLEHLEGETVGILVDGATHDTKVVSSGAITLDAPVYAARIQIGLPYNSDLETLPLHAPQDQGTIRESKKSIAHVSVEVDDYRGLLVGHTLDDLREVQSRSVESGYETINPQHSLVTVRPANRYARVVNLAVRQADPLPVTLLSLIIAVDIGGNQ